MANNPTTESRKANAFALFRAGKLPEALHQVKVLCNTGKADAQTWCLRAVLEGQTKDVFGAAQSARKAVELEPENADCHFNLGLALLYCNHPLQAAGHFQRTAEISPERPFINQFIAQALEASGDLTGAHDYYEKALAMAPGNVDVLAFVGRRYELMQETDKARATVEKALAIAPMHPEANIIMARLDRYADNLEQACDRLLRLLETPLEPADIATASNELGHTLDRMGAHEQAFEAFGKKILGARIPGQRISNPENVHRRIAHIKRRLTRETVADWKSSAPDDGLPDPVFLVAFPRSGTTLLERILGTNPDVVTTNEEGLVQQVIDAIPMLTGQRNNYPENLAGLSSEEIGILRSKYWELAGRVTGCDPQKNILFDKLPLNLLDLPLINRLFPSAPIILALRDPRDVCLSCLMQIFYQNDAMAAFNTIDGAARLYADSLDLYLHYRDILDLRLFESRYEDLVANPEPRIRALVEFLELPWSDDYLSHHSKKHYKAQSTPSGLDVSRPIYKRAAGRWVNYAPFMQSALRTLQPMIETLGYDDVDSMIEP